jgi:hypothetical protein
MSDWYSKNAANQNSLLPNNARAEYEKKLLARSPGNAPEVPAEAAPAVQNLGEKMGSQMATQSAQQGNMTGTAAGAMMMTGNPYLMAGGLGLQVLSAGEQNKRNEKEQQRLAYNDRIAQRQKAMSQIASMGIQ